MVSDSLALYKYLTMRRILISLPINEAVRFSIVSLQGIMFEDHPRFHALHWLLNLVQTDYNFFFITLSGAVASYVLVAVIFWQTSNPAIAYNHNNNHFIQTIDTLLEIPIKFFEIVNCEDQTQPSYHILVVNTDFEGSAMVACDKFDILPTSTPNKMPKVQQKAESTAFQKPLSDQMSMPT
uniref:Uncharacterized protein n=1 Tax=Glossina pallidipes TaxID=7398 RepID=A0A1A9ZBW1_GLOPL